MKQAEASIKLQQKRQSKEDLIANDQRKWSEILPKFESL
jgi:predicted GIY-YIG superfamily endonuclease